MGLFHMDFGEMDATAKVLEDGGESMVTTVDDLLREVEELLGVGFVTEVASERFGEGYRNLSSGLVQALGGLADMATGLRTIAEKSGEFDHKLAEG
ncbi:WXG100 family type VII secretion target [Microbacterium sp. MPKO10]|uniref:WXG100 family type VII secretion target n=1 Tax=Microbacterium sp. MPKO10 TaxID=2989818 RepID=UPI002235BD8D|nr:WXG100 family type VII secretion target [Microbacterium sp. MPKO10]MCW4458976.1 WXG100 family type VII secretion target [Microbacterium sp. MPKO10]